MARYLVDLHAVEGRASVAPQIPVVIDDVPNLVAENRRLRRLAMKLITGDPLEPEEALLVIALGAWRE